MTTAPTTDPQSFEERALSLLRRKSSYGQSLENHCLRLAKLTLALGEKNHVDLAGEIIYGACYLHDIGLCVEDQAEGNYLKRGAAFVEPFLRDWEMTQGDIAIVMDVMLYSHSIKPVPGITPQADMVRKAVSVEHSLGLLTHGLARKTIREIKREHPRLDFNRVLASFFKKALVDDDTAQIFRVFFPSSRP